MIDGVFYSRFEHTGVVEVYGAPAESSYCHARSGPPAVPATHLATKLSAAAPVVVVAGLTTNPLSHVTVTSAPSTQGAEPPESEAWEKEGGGHSSTRHVSLIGVHVKLACGIEPNQRSKTDSNLCSCLRGYHNSQLNTKGLQM